MQKKNKFVICVDCFHVRIVCQQAVDSLLLSLYCACECIQIQLNCSITKNMSLVSFNRARETGAQRRTRHCKFIRTLLYNK